MSTPKPFINEITLAHENEAVRPHVLPLLTASKSDLDDFWSQAKRHLRQYKRPKTQQKGATKWVLEWREAPHVEATLTLSNTPGGVVAEIEDTKTKDPRKAGLAVVEVLDTKHDEARGS